MTTADDWWFRSWWHQAARHGESATEAYASMTDALLSAPESVRLELAALLNPWRPIDTARKDKPLLLRWRTCRRPHIGEWSVEGDREGWRCDGDKCIPKNQGDCTHFQFLPAPPSEDVK